MTKTRQRRTPAPWTAKLIGDVAGEIPKTHQSSEIYSKLLEYWGLSSDDQARRLQSSYAFFERRLLEAVPELTSDAVRARVVERYRPYLKGTPYQLIFESCGRQRVELVCRLLAGVLESATSAGHSSPPIREIREWVARQASQLTWPVPGVDDGVPPESDADWLELLGRLLAQVCQQLEALAGSEACQRLVLAGFGQLADQFAEWDALDAVVGLLPNSLFDAYSVDLLSRDQLQRVLLGKLAVGDAGRTEPTGVGKPPKVALPGVAEAPPEVGQSNTGERVRAVLDAAGEGILTTDGDGQVVLVNEQAGRLWGLAAADIVGRPLVELLDVPVGVTDVGLDLSAFPQGLGEHVEEWIELDGVGVRGQRFPVAVRFRRVTSSSGDLFACVVRDLTEQRRVEEAFRASRERLALAIQGANDGLWDWDLTSGEVFYSARWSAMLGLQPDAAGSSPEVWFRRVHPDDMDRLREELDYHLTGNTDHFENEHRVRHQDGSYRWMLTRGIAVRDENDRPVRLVGSMTDLTERKVNDLLTGLPNRAVLMRRLGRAFERAKADKSYQFAVLFIDLDRFKVVNDSLGHLVGDLLLLAIARRLEACLRGEDTVARVGGDEFTVVLNGIHDVSDAKRIADRIHKELTAPFFLKRQEVFTTASIGIALSSTGYEQPEELLRDADTAMYRAKALGKARYEVFDMAMRARAVALLELETDLRRSVEREQFELHYQPIVALKNGQTVGFEALVRWRHPTRGLVAPDEFIGIAEETGLIVPLGFWVLREACRQARAWELSYPDRDLTVAVNLSGKQFSRPDLAEQIAQIVRDTGLSRGRLKLELTESMLMENADHAIDVLNRLRALDINLCIDDFGTGYSSLSSLHRFPIDLLKVDRSFVSRMGPGGENAEIVRTIVTLAHNLDMEVVAEGVETVYQLEQLRALRCDYWQGFYYAKPKPAADLAELIGPAPGSLRRERSGARRLRRKRGTGVVED